MVARRSPGPAPPHAGLSASLEPIAAAAARGQYELLLAETERAFTRLDPGASCRVLTQSGGAWRPWSALGGHLDQPAVALPKASAAWDRVCPHGAFLFVPIVTGAVAAVLTDHAGGAARDDFDVLRSYVALALQNCERQRIASQNLDEVQSLQLVASRILKSHDLDEILQTITQETKRLLDADICGVMLREGEDVVMRRCVGNHAVETASLRMKPGQGIAGRVLEKGQPVFVEDYLRSQAISRDFFHLAEAEAIRSALAVPLMYREELTGVLEVWRRRPSTFTTMDSSRMAALANLTSIAIKSASLYASQQRMVDELAQANDALSRRYDVVNGLSDLTQSLMETLLGGQGLPAIFACAHGFLGGDVAVLDMDLRVRAWGGDGDRAVLLPSLTSALRGVVPSRPSDSAHCMELRIAEARWLAQPLLIEGSLMGWIAACADHKGTALAEMAVAQVTMVTALHHLEQRAASRARAETIDALVWDLLHGGDAARVAAIDRAAEIGIDLTGPLRLFLCEVQPCLAGEEIISSPALRRHVLQAIGAVRPGSAERVRAIALRGQSVAIICTGECLDRAERWAMRLAQRMAEALPGRSTLVGGSGLTNDARGLAVACRESLIALDVGRQLQNGGAVVYDRAGVVGLLLSLREESGMRRFLDLNFGGLLREDVRHRDQLLLTLRAFFDANCSHEAAARRLGIHRKTVGYRLAKIAELTGLDLSTHDDRLVADLSLYGTGFCSPTNRFERLLFTGSRSNAVGLHLASPALRRNVRFLEKPPQSGQAATHPPRPRACDVGFPAAASKNSQSASGQATFWQ